MEIKLKHITLDKFLEVFKPALDTTSQKVELSNENFMIIAALLKIINKLDQIK